MKKTDYQNILREISAEIATIDNRGEVAAYIPELANVDPGKLGAHLTTIGNEHFSFGVQTRSFRFKASQRCCP